MVENGWKYLTCRTSRTEPNGQFNVTGLCDAGPAADAGPSSEPGKPQRDGMRFSNSNSKRTEFIRTSR